MGQGRLDPERGYLNKWEMYKALSGEYLGPGILPQTAPFEPASFQAFMRVFPSVYIKPIDAWGGSGVSRVFGEDGQYVWHAQGQAQEAFPDKGALFQALSGTYAFGHYIIQQEIPMVQLTSRPCDVRVLMQRDTDDAWVCAGMLTRLGGSGSVVSNVEISGGSVVPVETFLSEVFPGRERRVKRIQQDMVKLGHAICSVLEPYRYFHEVGIDCGVDKMGRPWIIEVNTDDAIGGPSHDLFAKLPDLTLYRKIEERAERNRSRNTNVILETLLDMFSEHVGDGPLDLQ